MICHQPVYLVMNPLERNPMAAFGDLIVIVVVGFVIVAGLSLLTIGAPRRRRSPGAPSRPLACSCGRTPNASFILDRGFLFRRRFWFAGTCCPPVRVEAARYRQLSTAQQRQPVAVASSGGRVWWWFENAFTGSRAVTGAGRAGPDQGSATAGGAETGPGAHAAQRRGRPGAASPGQA